MPRPATTAASAPSPTHVFRVHVRAGRRTACTSTRRVRRGSVIRPCRAGCFARPVVDGIPCSSGNLCQVGEACTAGVCRGAPRDCPAPPANSCRVAACDPQTGACGFTESPNGTPCNDGDFCTVGETCQAGSCGAARPRDCNPQGEPCRTGTCDEANDRCVVQNRPDATGCDDGAYCTVNDRCFDGVCRAIQLRDCPDANAGCRVGRCNEGGRSMRPRKRVRLQTLLRRYAVHPRRPL
jgi:hypothetical protein